MCPRDRESSNAHTGADDSMDSAATTEEPLQRTTTDTSGANDDASENVKPSVNASIYDPRWVEVRHGLVKLAEGGNSDIARYGNMLTDQHACCRFLKGGKGNVRNSIEMFKTHLEWRVKYNLDAIVDEDFSDLKEHKELYWGGRDKDGVMTLMWRLNKHDAKRTDAKRFVRFFVHQIESGLRTCSRYPNGQFNIMVDLDKAGYANADQEMGIILQGILAKNYPKVRKGLYVFPINWFVQLFWDTLLKPLLATLQPDIEDKICPLTGDWKAKLRERYELSEIESAFGGSLDVNTRPLLPILPLTIQPWNVEPEIPADVIDSCAYEAQASCALTQVSTGENAPIELIMTLGLDFSIAGSEGSETRDKFKRDVADDLATASGLPSASFNIKKVSAGSIIVDMQVMPDPLAPGTHLVAAKDLANQAVDSSSKLRAGTITSHAIGVEVIASKGGEVSANATPLSAPAQDTCHAMPAMNDDASSCAAPGSAEKLETCVAAREPHATDSDKSDSRRKMASTRSQEDLKVHLQHVLHSAHGGVWDASSSTERAVLMKAAIHSMTEAGLDEEVAQRVFELDKVAVDRFLMAATTSSNQGSAPTAEDARKALLDVAKEYGLVLSTPKTPPVTPDVVRGHWQNPRNLMTMEKELEAAAHSAGREIDDDFLRDIVKASKSAFTADEASDIARHATPTSEVSRQPLGAVGQPKASGGRKGVEKKRSKAEEGEDSDEEGTFNLVFSQLELLRLLQVVMR